MKAPETNYIALQRGTNAPEAHWTTDTTPEGFAAFLYDAPSRYLQDGDTVYLCGYAKFAKEREWRLPSIELVGVSQPDGSPSELFTCCTIDPGGGKTAANTASIVLAQRNIFRNLKLVGRCWDKTEDAAITGHDKGGEQFVLFDGCDLDAAENQDWGVYYQWSGNVNNGETIIRNCMGRFSRFLVSECGSASPKARLTVENAKLYGDADGSYTEGATNRFAEESACCPFLFRSGVAKFTSVECWNKGPSNPPTHYKLGVNRVVGLITNVYSSAAGAVTFTGKNVFVRELVQGHANAAYDIDLRYGSPVPTIDNSAAIAQAETTVQPLLDEATRLTATAEAELAAARGGSGEGGELIVWKP